MIAYVFLIVWLQVLREVKVLSSLQHVNIVGYHTAWLEHVQKIASEYLAVEQYLFSHQDSDLM